MQTTDYEIRNTENHKVVLFGGAFNPPHLGHLIVIQQAFELIDSIDELWLMPCHHHTFDKKLVESTHRLAMLKLLLDELPETLKHKVKICPIEIDFQLSGQTIEAIHKLHTEAAYLQKMNLLSSDYEIRNTEYAFLMGSDNVKAFKRWSRWQDLIKMIHFFVYPRAGQLPHKLYPNMSLLESDTQIITNFSSTIIRHRIERGLSLQNFIPKKVFDYIAQNKIYL